MEAALPTPDSHPRQWAVFSQLDADGSGTLDIEEIFAYLADMDENIANELMEELDTNNDGEVDFEEFCNGWDRIFIVSGGDPPGGEMDAATGSGSAKPEPAEPAQAAAAAAGEAGEESAAATAVQAHYRGYQARKDAAFRDQLVAERRDAADGGGAAPQWDSSLNAELEARAPGGAAGGGGDDYYSQPLYQDDASPSRQEELAALDAARQRQQAAAAAAAELRQQQELELEAEAMAREDEYLRRMREGLVRRGMLGASTSPRSAAGAEEQEHEEGGRFEDEEEEEEEEELDEEGARALGKSTPALLMPSAKEALSLNVLPLAQPTYAPPSLRIRPLLIQSNHE